MTVHGSISVLATAYETITLSQTDLGESPNLPHRLRLVLGLLLFWELTTAFLASNAQRSEREYLYVPLSDCEMS